MNYEMSTLSWERISVTLSIDAHQWIKLVCYFVLKIKMTVSRHASELLTDELKRPDLLTFRLVNLAAVSIFTTRAGLPLGWPFSGLFKFTWFYLFLAVIHIFIQIVLAREVYLSELWWSRTMCLRGLRDIVLLWDLETAHFLFISKLV